MPDEKLAPAVVMALLSQVEDLAALFTAATCTGLPGDPCCCPVARYVARLSGTSITVDGVEWDDGTGVSQPTPRNVARFVGEFDEGAYPDLIDGIGRLPL